MSYSNYNHLYRRNKLAEPAQLTDDADLWTPTVDQKYMLGSIFETNQGDEYRYCRADGTAIAKAVLVCTPAFDTQQVAKEQTSYGADAGEVVFEVHAATGSEISDDELVDGYCLISDGGAAMGDLYIIKRNTWVVADVDTLMRVEIADAGGLRTAIAATDDISFFKNQFMDVIVKPATLLAPIMGATTTIIPASYYAWIKTKGVTSILCDNNNTLIVGEPVGHIDGTTAIGTIDLVATAATDTILGTCLYPSAVDEATLINLQIPGV